MYAYYRAKGFGINFKDFNKIKNLNKYNNNDIKELLDNLIKHNYNTTNIEQFLLQKKLIPNNNILQEKNNLEKFYEKNILNTILNKYPTSEISNENHDQMVERLLVEFGWPVEKFSIKNKLADCIIENEGGITINKSLTGNDIRIICENYCKDLADTLSSITGYSATELSDLVITRFLEYKSPNRRWHQ